MSYLTTDQAKAKVLAAIKPATRHNRTVRPNPRFGCTLSAFAGGATLIAALYCELDEQLSRAEVEESLLALAREGAIHVYPESAQGDLTEYDELLALSMGNQFKHWVEVA